MEVKLLVHQLAGLRMLDLPLKCTANNLASVRMKETARTQSTTYPFPPMLSDEINNHLRFVVVDLATNVLHECVICLLGLAVYMCRWAVLERLGFLRPKYGNGAADDDEGHARGSVGDDLLGLDVIRAVAIIVDAAALVSGPCSEPLAS